ncbi:MAG: hypothetical protein AAFX85_12220 [Pseudomonadota bacterium]
MDNHDHLRLKLERGATGSTTPVLLNTVIGVGWGFLFLVLMLLGTASEGPSISGLVVAVGMWCVVPLALFALLAGMFRRTGGIGVLVLGAAVFAVGVLGALTALQAALEVRVWMAGAVACYGLAVSVAAGIHMRELRARTAPG